MNEQVDGLIAGLERVSAERLAPLGVYIGDGCGDDGGYAKVLAPMGDGAECCGCFGP